MWISSIQLTNIKGFKNSGEVKFSKGINILIGSNNSGKSTILRAIYKVQKLDSLSNKAVRVGENTGEVTIKFEQPEAKYHLSEKYFLPFVVYTLHRNGELSQGMLNRRIINPLDRVQAKTTFSQISNVEPANFIYPFLSKRKVTTFSVEINEQNTKLVADSLINLYPKIDRITEPYYQPANNEYEKICMEIFGFHVSSAVVEKGKHGCLRVNMSEIISVEEMGEGIINLLGLIVDLCVAEGKLFLIEELENDIHPKALKCLLEFIIKKSEKNQFIISTHSNIVTKYLGAIPESKLFHVTMNMEDGIPTSYITEIGDAREERIKVLEELGYELFDFDLWKAYLILEESSAERIIRDFLIPEFIPDLKDKLKTIASQGIDDVEPRFNDFLRLFVFIHTTTLYENKAWILVDGDTRGQDIIKNLKDKFKSWSENHFQCFSKKNFEEYYPERFQEKVVNLLGIEDKQKKREAKKELLDEVRTWIGENREIAIKEFNESAEEVIKLLDSINKALKSISSKIEGT